MDGPIGCIWLKRLSVLAWLCFIAGAATSYGKSGNTKFKLDRVGLLQCMLICNNDIGSNARVTGL